MNPDHHNRPLVVTLTMNPAIDESAEVEHVVADRKLRCSTPLYEPGGGGINVARAIHRLGGRTLAIYPAGGPAGRLLEELLDGEGVPQRPLPIAGWTRENLNVRERATRRQFRFVLPGPELLTGEGERCLEALRSLRPPPEYLVASGSLPPGLPPNFYARIAALAKEMGARLLLDASGEPLRLALGAGVYLAKPSLREFEELTGTVQPGEPRLLERARQLLVETRCTALVLSLGAKGALFVTATEAEQLGSPGVVVASTVGAGDSMLGGIALFLAAGRSLREAVRFGLAAAASSVRHPGTQLCDPRETDLLYAQMAPAQS
jgi:6-phosphofructokinase 2